MNFKVIPTDPQYAELWYEWRQDGDAKKYNPFAPSTIDALRDRLSKASSDIESFEKVESFIWFFKNDNDVVGNLSLHHINRMMLTAEIGYIVSAHARGRGVATQSVRYLTELCFTRTPLRKLIAYVHEENSPSRRVLEKAGYKAEGLLQKHYLIDGKPVNEVIYGALREDVTTIPHISDLEVMASK